MSPYREDSAKEPSDGLTSGEREARERRAARRRGITIAVGVPAALLLVAGVVGVLLDMTAPNVPPPTASAASSVAIAPVASNEAGRARRPRGPIFGTVEDSCYYGCPTYADAWASAREGREPPKWCVVGDRTGTCTRVETGTCGATRYVKIEVDPICGGSTRYFDEAGTLVGVEDVSPMHEPRDGGGYHDPIRPRTYGHIPDCDLVASETTCAKPVE